MVVDESKKAKFRLLSLAKSAKSLGKFDLALSFRSSFASKFLLFFINARQKAVFKKSKTVLHQVLKYANFVKNALGLGEISTQLKLHFTPQISSKKTLALNPGASYGSAKRWYPEYFAQVALNFKDEFEIVIFGGKGEQEICEKIEQILKENGVACQNLAGKTSVKELCQRIAGLSKNGIFVTNDSGPMHVAAAFHVPTIALFGPTKFSETSPWGNEFAKIVHLNLACMPCMKRVCPLKTHACMKDLKPQIVIDEINLLRKRVGFR